SSASKGSENSGNKGSENSGASFESKGSEKSKNKGSGESDESTGNGGSGNTGGSSSNGNSGTVKIINDSGDSANDEDEDAKVCLFHIYGFQFNANKSGTWHIDCSPNGTTDMNGTWDVTIG